MADVKISALPAATTPLTGGEVLPIVQSGVTAKVTVGNLTAGRSVSATSVAITGSTSGTATIVTPAVAGTPTITLPIVTGTLATLAGTETLTNKTLTGAAMNGTVGATTPSTGAFTSGTFSSTVTAASINFGQTALSYYGEGTWTPTDASGASLSFTGAVGTYTRIGRWTNYTGFLTYPATASGVSAVIGGLPFVSAVNAPGSCLSGSATATVPMVNSGQSELSFYTDGTVNNKLNSAFSAANVWIAGGYSV